MFVREDINQIANDQGLVLLGCVNLEEDSFSYNKYLIWLQKKKHAKMHYMEKHKNFRKTPSELLKNSKSALVLAYNYYQGDKYSDLRSSLPRIAQYARLKDYHKFLRKKGEKIVSFLQEKNPTLNSRILVDSAPILEKSLAANSLEGFIGKNSLFIHPKLGSYYFLFEILLDCEVSYDLKAFVDPKKRTHLGGCGTCQRCSVYCPTGALDQEYVLDARKCISYYTIEHRGVIPKKYWPYLKDYIFGCDICQMVCPYNKGLSLTELIYKKLEPHVDLFKIATMDQKEYEKIFGGTPLTRAKKEGLQRNALIAMTMTCDKRLLEAIQVLMSGEVKQVVFDTICQIERRYRF